MQTETSRLTSGTETVKAVSQFGEIEYMNRAVFEQHFEGLGWHLEGAAGVETPANDTPVKHTTWVKSSEVNLMGCYVGDEHQGRCSCGWSTDKTSSTFMVNQWRTEHEQAAMPALAGA